MNNKKRIQFVESLILLPFVTASMPFGGLPNKSINAVSIPQTVLAQKQNIESNGLLAFNQAVDQKVQITKMKAEAIDAYFKEHDMPLFGMGMKMVQEAEKNDLDWRLLAGISVIETTGGKHLCKNPKAQNNPFGWGSCKIGFGSFDEAIETVGRNLGGNNPNTDHHYAGKTTKEILQKYNPPSIVPKYADKVMNVMKEIGDEEVVITTNI